MKRKPTKPAAVPAVYSRGFVKKMDGRVRAARIVRARLAELVTDLGGELSYQRRSLCERIVHIEALISGEEQQLREGKRVDVGSYRQNINALVGLYRTVGIERRPKPVRRLADIVGGKASP